MFRIYKENRFLSGFSINAIFLGTFLEQEWDILLSIIVDAQLHPSNG